MHTTRNINIINYFIAFLPISLIIGNLVTNLNIIFVCIAGLLIFKKEIFFFKKSNKVYFYILYIFFFYLISLTLWNYIPILKNDTNVISPLYKENIFKSFFFLRFLLLFLILNKLIEKNYLNLKLFIIVCSISSFLIAFDIYIHLIFKCNLIGREITAYRPSSFFGSENIAGGYLQKFIFFFIFYLLIQKKIIKNNFFYFTIFSLLFLIPIILTGNRMPGVIYLFSILVYLIIEKKFKEIIFVLFFFFFIIFLNIKNPMIGRLDIQIKAFAEETKIISMNIGRLFYQNKIEYDQDETLEFKSNYLLHFNSAIQIWKNNKLFGHGLKSFPLNCKIEKNQTCSTHPHNYFLEILVDTGFIGILLIYSLFFIGLINFYKFYFFEHNLKLKLLSMPFFLIIFFEFFPFRSTGSFFTTGNAVIVFLFLSIFLNIKKIKNYRLL